MEIWQTIETAPYGEKILVYSATGPRKGAISFGLLKQYACDDSPKWSLDGSRIKGLYSPPTAWMPLPSAPSEA
jgi:hypothetical protein